MKVCRPWALTGAYFLLCLLILIQLFACQKTTEPSVLTTAVTRSTKAPSNPIARIFWTHVQNDPFANTYIQRLIATYGTIAWDQAIVQEQQGRLACLLPLVTAKTDMVSAMIAMEWDTSLKMKVYDLKSYRNRPFAPDSSKVARTGHLFSFRMSGKQPYSLDGLVFQKSEQEPTLQTHAGVIPITYNNCYWWTVCRSDGKGNCIGTVYYHEECVYSTVWMYQPDYVQYLPYPNPMRPSYPPMPIGGPPTTPAPVAIPKTPIGNIASYIKCYNRNLPAKLILYADQPLPGSDEVFTITGKMGHAFIAIEQIIGGQPIRRTIGFHPQQPVNPFGRTNAPSMLGMEENTTYDVALPIPISAGQLNNLLNAMTGVRREYDLEKYNCVDFCLDAAQAAGISLPRTEGWWIIGRGRNPADFGQDLRRFPGVIIGKTKSAPNIGSCP